MAEIYLITCVKRKRKESSPASEMYISSNFRKLRALAEKRADRWYILSAKYGLLKPEQVIDPYELTLNDMPRSARREWAKRVFRQLAEEIEPTDRITILAGKKYWDELKPLLEDYGCEVLTPLEGISLFGWGRWLNKKLADD